tara:strand:+ start:451 stop:600 length:150 start_codon:yes stop_codon:yes gene_type:complete
LKQTRLLRLEELHNDGLLTDAEYQAKREEILGEVCGDEGKRFQPPGTKG